MKSLFPREHIVLRKLIWVGPLTIVSTTIANLIIHTMAVAFFGVSSTFHYFQAAFIVGSTIVYVLLALLVFVLVSRFAQRPIQFYWVLALVALGLSFLSPIMALTGQLSAPGMNQSIFWTMIVMHSVSAMIVVGLLTTLARKHA